jgi:hypothetical protein
VVAFRDYTGLFISKSDVFFPQRLVARFMETRERIIDDLRRFGVKVNQILLYNPSLEELRGMRDGLMRLNS